MKWLKSLFNKEDEEKRGAHRLSLKFNIEVKFIPEGGQPLEVLDISSSGIGIKNDPSLGEFTQEDDLRGQLHLGDEELTLQIRVARVNEHLVAGSFVDPPANLFQKMAVSMDAEVAGHKSAPIDSELLRTPPDGQPGWYRDPGGNELYVVEKEGQVQRFYLQYGIHYLESRDMKSVSAAIVDTEAHPGKIKRSEIINYIERLKPEDMRRCIRFVENMDRMDDSLRQTLLKLLNTWL